MLDKTTVLYKCDPNKNTTCNKRSCFYTKLLGQCEYTTDPQYSVDGVAYNVKELMESKMKKKENVIN